MRVSRNACDGEETRQSTRGTLHRVEWTAYAAGTVLEEVGVDHGRGHVAVAGELLHGANVVAALQQVAAKEWRKRVCPDQLRELHCVHRSLQNAHVLGVVGILRSIASGIQTPLH